MKLRICIERRASPLSKRDISVEHTDAAAPPLPGFPALLSYGLLLLNFYLDLPPFHSITKEHRTHETAPYHSPAVEYRVYHGGK